MKNNHPFKTKNLASPARAERVGWRDALKERIETLSSVIESKIKTINGLISRNGGRGLIGVLLKYTRTIHSRASKSVVRQVAAFAFFCWRIARHSGLKGVVIYLKASQVLLQQVVGGFRVLDLGELKVRPARNKAGVPLVIPAGVRVRISRDRNIQTIRLWMTLFGLYRILEFRGKLSLSTIISKGPNLTLFHKEWESFIRDVFLPQLVRRVGKLPNLGPLSLFPILKSGPTTTIAGLDRPHGSKEFVNSSGVSLIYASRLILWSKNLANSFKSFASGMGKPAVYFRMRMASLAHCDLIDDPKASVRWPEKDLRPYPAGQGFLGKLGFKVEPAGKIRVFAMVDAWTQWLMAPLHEWIFGILRKIPQDGTFNQMRPIERLQRKYGLSPKGKTFASIDLSSATDRLPISLQVILLKVLLEGKVKDSSSFAKNWAELLVARPYRVAPSKSILANADLDFDKDQVKAVFYAVGQPMGALSSWAMLAITHHALIQFAFYKAYGREGWYGDYGVLGDDGVIVDGRVVSEYRNLLRVIGVKAGLAKSILAKSKFVIEFAKKFFVDSTQANMVPIKECVATSVSTSLVMEFVRKYELSLNQILSFLGYGYKAKMKIFNSLYFKLSTRARVLLVWLTHPSSPLGKPSYFEWLLQRSYREYHTPSSAYLVWLVDQCRALVDLKVDKMLEAFGRYQDSLNNVDKTLDKVYPVKIVTSVDKGDYTQNSEFLYSWKGILNPDLTDQREADFWDDSFEASSSIGYRWQKAQEELQSLKLGIDFDEIYLPAFGALQEMYDNASGPIPDQINALLHFYFEPDLITSRIPEEFWREYRETVRPFRDFSEIYKLWQDLTKPLWAEYHRGVEEPIKVSRSPGDPKPPVREEPEGSATVSPIMGITIGSWVIKLLKVSLWLIAQLVELSFVLILVGFLASLSTEVAHDPAILVSESPRLLDCQCQTYGYWLMGLGSSLILASMLVTWVMTGSILPAWWPMDIAPHTDVLVRRLSEVQGPLTLHDYRALQNDLVTDALLENLAISPIGELWKSPW